jgi:hypothetical protein
MSDGMLAQARTRSSQAQWRKGPAEMRAQFESACIEVSDQHRVRRPAWARLVSYLITVGIKP